MTAGLGAQADELPSAEGVANSRAVGRYRMPAMVFHWFTVFLVVFMVSSAVIAKQLSDGPISDMLFSLHKATGALTLVIVLLRLLYRLTRRDFDRRQPEQRPVIHGFLYGAIILVPLLGWAAVSDFGSREIFPGYALPAIWPEHAGYADLLFQMHAYLAFGLLALVALHVGIALQDYMMRSDAPARGE